MRHAVPDFADWLAISNLKAHYCRLLDTKDWAGLEALFTPDIVLDASASGGPVLEGRGVVVASLRGSIEAARTVHHVHSPEITLDGDSARAIWAMQDRLVWDNGRIIAGAGHYHEDYRRTDGVWQIARSRLTRLMLNVHAVAE